MPLESTSSHSTADERMRFVQRGNASFLKGTNVSEPDLATGSEVEKYTETKSLGKREKPQTDASLPWCYLFVHHKKVKAFEAQLKKDGLTYFIHTSIKYAPKRGESRGVRKMVVQTVSGLIFLRGNPDELQMYLNEKFPLHRLCINCSTGEVARIPNSQMEPFMRVVKSDPERIRFLLRPFVYYSKNRTLLRIVSGDFAGLEGYVIRIARDRKLVMDVGGMSVAIGGVHAERYEEVGKNEDSQEDRVTFYKRNLHERNAFIDRYFHKVKTAQEVAAQTENIEILRLQTLTDLRENKIDLKEAYESLSFVVEEIAYYYAPFIDLFKAELNPIFNAGRKVVKEIENLITALPVNDNQRLRWEAETEEMKVNYGYLFE